jgi:hypothetical protein
MRLIYSLILIVLIASPVFGAEWERNERVGSTGFQFLKQAVDARSAALGTAVTADARGGGAFFANPAWLALNDDHFLTLEGLTLPADIKMGLIGYSHSLGAIGTIGVSAVWLDAGVMEKLSIYPDENLGDEFTANDLALGLSYGVKMTDKFSFGVEGKYIREQLEDEEVTGFVAGIGTMFYTGYRSIAFGMSIRNFGEDVGFFDGEEYDSLATQLFPMPMVFRLGVSADVLEIAGSPSEQLRLGLNVDFTHPNDAPESFDLGLELAWLESYFIRLGYRQVISENEDTIRPMSFGAGANLNIAGLNAQVDLALVEWGDLGMQQRLGLCFGL